MVGNGSSTAEARPRIRGTASLPDVAARRRTDSHRHRDLAGRRRPAQPGRQRTAVRRNTTTASSRSRAPSPTNCAAPCTATAGTLGTTPDARCGICSTATACCRPSGSMTTVYSSGTAMCTGISWARPAPGTWALPRPAGVEEHRPPASWNLANTNVVCARRTSLRAVGRAARRTRSTPRPWRRSGCAGSAGSCSGWARTRRTRAVPTHRRHVQLPASNSSRGRICQDLPHRPARYLRHFRLGTHAPCRHGA